MKLKSLLLAFAALIVSAVSLAAPAVPGQWRAAMGMDGVTMNYSVSDAKGNLFSIMCGNEPAAITVAINNHEYGPSGWVSNYAKGDFRVNFDGRWWDPSDAGSNVGGDNFRATWEAIRAGKKITVKGGKDSMILPVVGAAKVLPANLGKCETW